MDLPFGVNLDGIWLSLTPGEVLRMLDKLVDMEKSVGDLKRQAKHCVTHHHACDCREFATANDALALYRIVRLVQAYGKKDKLAVDIAEVLSQWEKNRL